MIRELVMHIKDRVAEMLRAEWEIIPLGLSALMIASAFTSVDTAFGRWCIQYMAVWILMFIFSVAIHGSKH